MSEILKFSFFRSYKDAIDDLCDGDKLAMYEAITNFVFYGIEPDFSGIKKTIFTVIRPNLMASIRDSLNGQLGGAKQGNQNARKTKKLEQKQPPLSSGVNKGGLPKGIGIGVGDGCENGNGIGNGEEKEKENPSPYNPPYPTLAEVEEYVFRMNLAVDARRFHSKMSGDGWTIDGEPVRDWRKLCQAWSRKQRESEEPDMSDRVLDDGTVIRNGKRYYTHPVSKHVIELPNNAPRRPDPALMYYFDEMDWKLPIQR